MSFCLRRSQYGFTLLEVMVALAILTLVLGALWQGLSQAAGLTQALPERVIARWVAQNRLVLRQARDEWPDTRTYTGTQQMADRIWHWEERVVQTEEPLLRRIIVRVGRTPQSLTLYSLEGYVQRPRPPAAFPRRAKVEI